jgi:hypothetical protein
MDARHSGMELKADERPENDIIEILRTFDIEKRADDTVTARRNIKNTAKNLDYHMVVLRVCGCTFVISIQNQLKTSFQLVNKIQSTDC